MSTNSIMKTYGVDIKLEFLELEECTVYPSLPSQNYPSVSNNILYVIPAIQRFLPNSVIPNSQEMLNPICQYSQKEYKSVLKRVIIFSYKNDERNAVSNATVTGENAQNASNACNAK